jgi:hypothetical protein
VRFFIDHSVGAGNAETYGRGRWQSSLFIVHRKIRTPEFGMARLRAARGGGRRRFSWNGLLLAGRRLEDFFVTVRGGSHHDAALH